MRGPGDGGAAWARSAGAGGVRGSPQTRPEGLGATTAPGPQNGFGCPGSRESLGTRSHTGTPKKGFGCFRSLRSHVQFGNSQLYCDSESDSDASGCSDLSEVWALVTTL